MGRRGRAIAPRNLRWSIFAEFLGFVVWQLWSIVVVLLPAAGFALDSSQIFWLISMPSLVGATLRFPYTFMVAHLRRPQLDDRLGGPAAASRRSRWRSASATRRRRSACCCCVAALAGFGGGNFASSMSNITFFYPQREKGWALGLNAAGGNLGASVAQFVVPIVVTIGAAATLNLPLAGWIWVPLILRRDVRRVALHGQPVLRQGRLRRLRRGAARAAPVAALAALHRHLRLVHRLRQRLPQAHRRPVPGVLEHRGRAAHPCPSPSSAPSSARSPGPTAAGSPTASAVPASRWPPSR